VTIIETDIAKIENTMKQLVSQQLGDKQNYDSSLNDIDAYDQQMVIGKVEVYEPLETLIKSALNYDSHVYR
jgi:hypothetical protein